MLRRGKLTATNSFFFPNLEVRIDEKYGQEYEMLIDQTFPFHRNQYPFSVNSGKPWSINPR